MHGRWGDQHADGAGRSPCAPSNSGPRAHYRAQDVLFEPDRAPLDDVIEALGDELYRPGQGRFILYNVGLPV